MKGFATTTYRHLFGPVPSRRLGASLGVDLVPPKTCTMDCVYCECGPTTLLTRERREYVPSDEVKAELDHYFSHSSPPAYVTFSGAGEPTLHSGIGGLLHFVRDSFRVPAAVITNSSLMDEEDVRESLMDAQLLLPSLDAVSPGPLAAINRPHPGVRWDRCVSGLASFRDRFRGEVWLEVFLLEPFNTGDDELMRIQCAIDEIRPHRVQLNTLDRPGTEAWVKPLSKEKLESAASRLRHPHVEIVSRYRRSEIRTFRRDVESAILETIRRRPCTEDDLVRVTGLPAGQLRPYIDCLEGEKKILPGVRDSQVFFKAPGCVE